MNIYEEYGYKDRNDYLCGMAEDYGVDAETVFALADVLGEDEDFDGLIAALEDTEDYLL